MKRPTVLIVEDQDINRAILVEIVSERYDVLEAANGAEALDVLQRHAMEISLILLDLVMPVMDGYEFLDRFSATDRYASIPIIVTTDRNTEKDELAALSRGATEFAPKPYQPQLLMHRIDNILKMRAALAEVNRLRRDQLTGLYNRDYFLQRGRELMEATPDAHHDVFCVNIQDFRTINERYGGAAGDALLKDLAHALLDTATKADVRAITGRFYADYFMGVAATDKETPAEKVLETEEFIKSRLSIPEAALRWGVCPDDGSDTPLEVRCDNAILAVRAIKGRHDVSVSYFDAALKERLGFERELAEEAQGALEGGQFEVHLQPKVKNGAVNWTNAEALVRWNHPERGSVSPAVFIPIFERAGLVGKLDRFVWEESCRLLRRWEDEGLGRINVSVNVSRADVASVGFVEEMKALVRRFDLEPSRLHLEITETAYVENMTWMGEVCEQLRAAGFVLEMDDFGSGYSSLKMLSQIQLDVLKIDRGLVVSEAEKPGLLRFVVGLAHWLNMQVVAEGVETKEQHDRMFELGCDYVQGYYTARPMPWQRFEESLREQRENTRGGASMTVEEFYAALDEDYRAVLARMMGNEGFLRSMLSKFAQGAYLDSIAAALGAQDVAATFDASHTLKGVADNLGLKPLKQATCVLVELARAGSLDGAQDAFDNIKRARAHVMELLAKLETDQGA